MDKLSNSQILKLLLIASLLTITPFLSTSHRTTYLYFVVNLLIIVVGAEAGLVSFFLEPPPESKRSSLKHGAVNNSGFNNSPDGHKELNNNSNRRDKVGATAKEQSKVKKSPSTPSIFFIEGANEEAFVDHDIKRDDGADDEFAEVSGQELFHKAETFIGNFYKQLKMQREESWKKLHDLYQKAF